MISIPFMVRLVNSGSGLLLGLPHIIIGRKTWEKNIFQAHRGIARHKRWTCKRVLREWVLALVLYLGKGLAACTKMQWINVVDTYYGNYGEEWCLQIWQICKPRQENFHASRVLGRRLARSLWLRMPVCLALAANAPGIAKYLSNLPTCHRLRDE